MTVVVAELGINHGGDLDTALFMIRAANGCGCDAVKVQSYRTKDFLPKDHVDYAMFERCEIWPHLEQLADEAHRFDLKFGVTPQIAPDAHEAATVADYLKVGSDCLTHHRLINACLGTGLPTWVSCGMGTWDEIEQIPRGAKRMLCTSLYPCPPDQANLIRLGSLFGFEGYSDHTEGIEAATVAAGCGVEMIEKHFTLDKQADGPDHFFSADPDEMAALVQAVRKASLLYGTLDYPAQQEKAQRSWRPAEGQLRK